jgi:hypothetical protein
MRGLVIAVLLSLICSAFGQDVAADAEKDGQALAQEMVSKRKGISWMDWSNVVKRAYAKHKYSDNSSEYEYGEVFKDAYQKAYTELGSTLAGPRPEQTAMQQYLTNRTTWLPCIAFYLTDQCPA